MELLLVGGAAVCVIAAAISDLRAFRIPNIYPLLLLVLFAVSRLIWGTSPADWGNLAHFLVALAAGMLLFKLGWFGGGDAKLYAAVAIWFSGLDAALLIFATGISGLLLAIAYFLARKLGRSADAKAKQERRIPYGVAIAGGALIMWAKVGVAGLVGA